MQYDEVEKAKVEAQDAFHMVVGHLLCTYGDDRETFQRVMEPINDQSRRTRRQVQRRGTVPPVDPETGEPVEPGEQGENPTGGQNDGGQPTDGSGTNDGESETNGTSGNS